MDYGSAAEFVKGKQVAVVGLQKSALDIAMECSIANGEKHKSQFTTQITSNSKIYFSRLICRQRTSLYCFIQD